MERKNDSRDKASFLTCSVGPEFIKQTGISELRDAAKEKAAAARGRAKRRARLNPKLGKMDVDYQKLYDAFFKFQTKPKLTRHGDM